MSDRLRQKRQEARNRTSRLRKTILKPSAGSWLDINEYNKQWVELTSQTVKAQRVCAVCGRCEFYDEQRSWCFSNRWSSEEIPPYSLSNPFLYQCISTESSNGPSLCRNCQRGETESCQTTSLSPSYIRDVLLAPVFYTQMMSLVDVSVNVTSRMNSIATGTPQRRSLLDNPLVSLSEIDNEENENTNHTRIKNILGYLLTHNKFVKKFQTLYERPNPRTGICILSRNSINTILDSHNSKAAYTTMEEANINGFSVLEDITPFESSNTYSAHQISHLPMLTPREEGTSLANARYMTLDGTALGTDTSAPPLTLESCLFPFLFPHGNGHFSKKNDIYEYLKKRISCMFSIHTLYKPYLMLMYQIRQANLIATSLKKCYLEKDIAEYQRTHPSSTEEEAIRHIIKFVVPKTIPNTPSWHRRHLKDLLAMVSKWGIPSFFLTLTADEVSNTRWQEIIQIENIVKTIDDRLRWTDCPVECAVLFHTRLQTFMRKYILCGNGILGNVEHYVIRYEIQNRHSLHAHIILWVSSNQIEAITNEIDAYIPAESDDPASKKLRELVKQKQIHTCRPSCYKHTNIRRCKYGFPYNPHNALDATLDDESQRWVYHRPSPEHQRVVPYHSTILLLWGAHMNLQRITNGSWSFYLLKYAVKCEPYGNLNLQGDDIKKLGIDGLDATKSKIISAMILSKPISATEAALTCLQIPFIHRSESVTYIDTSPPATRIKVIARGSNPTLHAIDYYCARPTTMHALTFKDFWSSFEVKKNHNTSNSIGIDSYGNTIVRTNRVVRFTDYHPLHHCEEFFYNILLQEIPFARENELLSPNNAASSYFHECQLRGLIASEEDILKYVGNYTDYHLLEQEDQTQLLNAMIQKLHPIYEFMIDTPNGEEEPTEGQPSIPSSIIQIPQGTLKPEQQMIFNALSNCPKGMHVISGTPGSGKTFLIKTLLKKYEEAGKCFLVTATTGIAACRICRGATTVHHQFALPVRSQWPQAISKTDIRYQQLKMFDVLIIDEMSMLTALSLHMILRQISETTTFSIEQVLQKKCLLLFGDHAQLPPICHHRRQDNEVCHICPLSSSIHYQQAQKYHLQHSVRHSTDKDYATFLDIIRVREPTDEEIIHVLRGKIVDRNNALDFIDQNTTILCTHNEDVHFYNKYTIDKIFRQHQLIQIDVETNKVDESELDAWISERSFHEIPYIAIGCKIIITTNIDVMSSIANGTTGIVSYIDIGTNNQVRSIICNINDTTRYIELRRSKIQYKYHNGKRFYKKTFPIALSYAITAHKSQGATIDNKALIVVRKAFSPGLLYVMFSRVRSKEQLRVVRPLSTADFQPNKSLSWD